LHVRAASKIASGIYTRYAMVVMYIWKYVSVDDVNRSEKCG